MGWPLRLVPKTAVVPILSGPVRGGRWVVGAATNGCWLGTYELAVARRVTELLRPGMTFFDIGANAGYYTLLAAQYVGDHGHVVAFEPVPRAVSILRRHVNLNRLTDRVTVVDAAVGAQSGTAAFATAQSLLEGHLCEGGDLQVRVVALDEEAAALPAPDFIKVDTEGAEGDVLRGARQLLLRCRPICLVSTHHELGFLETIKAFRELGYQTITGVGGSNDPRPGSDVLALP